MKAVIILNPTSGKEKASEYKVLLQKKLREQYDEVIIRETEQSGDATRLAKEESTADLLVVMSGDGTLGEAINGLATLDKRPPLAFIPLGTVNEFARALNMPLDPEAVIQQINTYEEKQIDLGKVNDVYFSNSVTFGTIPDAMHDVSSEAKTMFGPLAFVAKGIQTLTKKEQYDIRVQYDEDRWEGEASIIILGLTSYIGGMEHFFPNAKTDDGLIHGMIVPELGLKEALKMAPELWKMQIQNSEYTHAFTCKTCQIEGPEALTNVDGEEGPHLPVTVQIYPQFLTVLAPK